MKTAILGLLGIIFLSISFMGCKEKHSMDEGTRQKISSQILKELPVGTQASQVERYLDQIKMDHSHYNNQAKDIFGKRERVILGIIRGTTIKTTPFNSLKDTCFEFQFDEKDQLKNIKIEDVLTGT